MTCRIAGPQTSPTDGLRVFCGDLRRRSGREGHRSRVARLAVVVERRGSPSEVLVEGRAQAPAWRFWAVPVRVMGLSFIVAGPPR
jgi:hypothetical protein